VLSEILIAFILVAVTVLVQAVGLTALLKALVKSYAQLPTRFWPVTWVLIRVTWALIFIHVTEIAVWALFFWWRKCLPDVESSLYFYGVN
jgi:voltage-gated potassium channel